MGYTGQRMKTLLVHIVGRQRGRTMRECDDSKEDALLQAIKKLLDDPEWTMKTIKRIEREMRTGRKG